MMMRLWCPSCSRNQIHRGPSSTIPTCCSTTLRSSGARTSVENPTVVAADPRPVQQRLLRARLPRAADGHRAGRGAGPVSCRTIRVFMRTTQGPAARGRGLPAHRRRLPRPAGLPPRLHAGRARPHVNAYRAGRVTLANAVGTGVADDKSIYPYVPDMIRFYLGRGADPQERAHLPALGADDDLKTTCWRPPRRAGGEGGARLGRLRHAGGPDLHAATSASATASASSTAPGRFIAQPTLSLSTCPTFVRRGHSHPGTSTCGLRAVRGAIGDAFVPGGLTRVALREGSLVVNSSQGGGRRKERTVRGGSAAFSRLMLSGAAHAEPHRFQPLLDVALRGAGREHRAHPRRGLPHVAPHAKDPAAAGPGVVRAAQHHRHPLPVHRAATFRGVRARSAALHGARPGQPLLDPRPAPRQARENARAVRGSITSEMWEVLNSTWLEMQQMDEDKPLQRRAASPQFFDWVKERSPPLPRRDLRHHAAARTGPSTSTASAPTSSAPTTPRASST